MAGRVPPAGAQGQPRPGMGGAPGMAGPQGAGGGMSPTIMALAQIEDFLIQIGTRTKIADQAGNKTSQEGGQALASLLKGSGGQA